MPSAVTGCVSQIAMDLVESAAPEVPTADKRFAVLRFMSACLFPAYF
jgi:hypothetical protein